MGIEWEFERLGRRQGAGGSAYRNPLEGTSGSQESKLAREAIQNSCDASNQVDQVKVRFRTRSLTGRDKSDFISALQLNEMLAGRLDRLRLPQNSALKTLQDGSRPLDILYIEDFNTTGLTGDPEDGTSKFHKFMFGLGDDSKAYADESTGGSFGFGKTVFANVSNCYIFLVYTKIKPEDSPDRATSRLMGAGFFNGHDASGESLTGRAWFADGTGDDSTPLRNDIADKLAERVGCTPRNLNETGTSIVVLGYKPDMAVLRKSIEDNWWPRLVENNLTVELWDGETKASPPRPKVRPELKSFINAFDIATGRAQARGNESTCPTLNRHHIESENRSVNLGAYAMVRVDPSVFGTEENEDRLLNKFALIRKPRMVVTYEPFCPRSQQTYVGVFVADDEVDGYLKLAEPPAHDKWSSGAARLKDAFENDTEGQKIVNGIFNRLRNSTSSWLRELAPRPTNDGNRIAAVDQLFGQIFARIGQGRTIPPGPSPDPITLEIGHPEAIDQPDGTKRLKLAPTIALRPDTEDDRVRVRLKPTCAYLVDSEHRRGDNIGIFVRESPAHPWGESIELEIARDTGPIRLDMQTDPFDARSIVDYDLSVEPIQ